MDDLDSVHVNTRALILSPIYPVPDKPQGGSFVHRQVVNLTRAGVQCRVLVYRPAPTFPNALVSRSWLNYYVKSVRWPRELDGVSVEQVFYKRPGGTGQDVIPQIGEALIKFIKQHPDYLNTEVIYAHWLWTGGAAALYLREQLGWPVVAIARGSEMHDWHVHHPLCEPYVKRVVRDADCTLANCRDLSERAERLVPGTSVGVVYNGCDAEMFSPAPDKLRMRRECGLDTTGRLLIFCGSIDARKGVAELAEAWGRFSAAHPEWRLVMVGGGDPALVCTLRELGRGRVVFTGQVPHSRVVSYLQAGDAYVQPSRLEGLANATMEAMAVGLPVVTTDTCGQRELIQDGENGWLIPPGDAGALGQALADLARNPVEARRRGAAARRTILEKFNPQKETLRLATILRETAQGTRFNSDIQSGSASRATYDAI